MHHRSGKGPNLDVRLTPREVQVAGLLSTGLTARAVGGRLKISTETVRSHTRSIFLKLRVRNRVEMAGRIFRMQSKTHG